MNCFEHKDAGAVGLCHICQRPICTKCSIAIQDVICCSRDFCVAKIRSRQLRAGRKAQFQRKNRAGNRVFALALTGVAVALLVAAVFRFENGASILGVVTMAILGLGIGAIALPNLIRRRD